MTVSGGSGQGNGGRRTGLTSEGREARDLAIKVYERTANPYPVWAAGAEYARGATVAEIVEALGDLFEAAEFFLSSAEKSGDEPPLGMAVIRNRARTALAEFSPAPPKKEAPKMDCPGCGAPEGYPPAGPCKDHGTMQAVGVFEDEPPAPPRDYDDTRPSDQGVEHGDA